MTSGSCISTTRDPATERRLVPCIQKFPLSSLRAGHKDQVRRPRRLREKRGSGDQNEGRLHIWLVLRRQKTLVYTTQVNSAFRARWLASSEVISQVIFTSEHPKRNKMASRFATGTYEENISIKETAITKNTKMATKFGLTVLHGKLFNLSSLIF